MEVYTEEIMLWYLEKNPEVLKNTVFFKCFYQPKWKAPPLLPKLNTSSLLKKQICISAEMSVTQQNWDLLMLAVSSWQWSWWQTAVDVRCVQMPPVCLFIAVLEIKTCKLPITSLGQNIPWKTCSVGTRKDKSIVQLQVLMVQSEAVLLSVLS